MGFRRRPMRPRDVAECARVIAAHPVIGPRKCDLSDELGASLSTVKNTWRSTTARPRACRAYFQITRERICGFPSGARKRGAFCWLMSASIPKSFARCRESSCGAPPNRYWTHCRVLPSASGKCRLGRLTRLKGPQRPSGVSFPDGNGAQSPFDSQPAADDCPH
jgi:hypothetical protein